MSRLTVFALFFATAVLFANDGKLKPGDTHKNSGKTNQYLVTVIEAGKSFKNTTDRNFVILDADALKEINDHLALQRKIDAANATLDKHTTDLDALEAKLREIEQKMNDLNESN